MRGTGYLPRCRALLREVRPPGCAWSESPVESPADASSDEPCPVFVVGTHGGAGTSTVASLLNALDSGRKWPEPPYGVTVNVILTARTNAAGLRAASRVLAGYCGRSYPEFARLAGFVLVADAPGRLPKPLNRRIAILASATMVFRLPWVSDWRLTETTPDPRTGGPVVTRLRGFVEQAARSSTPATY